MSTLLKVIYRPHQHFSKFQQHSLKNQKKLNKLVKLRKYHLNHKRLQRTIATLSKESEAGENSRLRNALQNYSDGDIMTFKKDTQTNGIDWRAWNKSIFIRPAHGAQKCQEQSPGGRGSVYIKRVSSSNCVETGHPHQKNKTRYLSLNIQKINSKQIRGLNIRLQILKLLEENIGETLQNINLSKEFFARP